MEQEKHVTINLPFDLLPEGQRWSVGKVYRVKLVLKQTGVLEDSATFEVVDANSLEAVDKSKSRYFTSDSGVLKR